MTDNFFPEYYDFFQAKEDKSNHTLRSYRQHINAFLNKFEVKNVLELDLISGKDIRLYLGELKVSNDTKNSVIRVLKVFFNWMKKEEYITKNVFSKIEKKNSTQKVLIIPTEEQMELIRSSTNNKTTKLIIMLLSRIGLRREEVSKVLVEDIDDGKLLIHGKGGKDRRISLPQDILDAIKIYLKEKTRKPSEYLFSYDGHGISGDAIYIRYNDYIHSLDCFTFEQKVMFGHPHILRHYALTQFARSGNPYLVKHVAGHSGIKIGEKYTHLADSLFDEATKNA